MDTISTTDYDGIRIERGPGPVAKLQIRPDDPGHRFDIPSMRLAARTIRALGEDASCRAVIIEARGEYFCAGGELGDFRTKDVADILAFGDAFIDFHTAVAETPVPIIAKVQGKAMGGGANLVETCDLAYAAESALFATPEITVGIAPMMAMAGLFRNLGRKQALGMAFFGENICAAEAKRIGLVNDVFPDANLDEMVDALVAQLVQNNPEAISVSKRLYTLIETDNYRQRLQSGQAMLAAFLKSDAASEALDAAEAKRRPSWTQKP